MEAKDTYLLEVEDLVKHYVIKSGFLNKNEKVVKAVDGISLKIKQGEILGLVGESGCGKSTLGRSILRLVEPTSGSVLYDGTNILNLSKNEVRLLRKRIQIIFQDPGASLNPRMTVGELLNEPLEIFGLAKGNERQRRIIELLNLVDLNKDYINRFPHEFSGGQRQRIGIARALAVEPEFIVCDEAVSALDVSVQAQILNLMKDLKKRLNLTYLFISHDLNVVNHLCDNVAVMYLGKVVEMSSKEKLYKNPAHPYTKVLLSAIPIPDPEVLRERKIVKGDVPNISNISTGCSFYNRCIYRMEECVSITPSLKQIDDNHLVSCHLFKNGS